MLGVRVQFAQHYCNKWNRYVDASLVAPFSLALYLFEHSGRSQTCPVCGLTLNGESASLVFKAQASELYKVNIDSKPVYALEDARTAE